MGDGEPGDGRGASSREAPRLEAAGVDASGTAGSPAVSRAVPRHGERRTKIAAMAIAPAATAMRTGVRGLRPRIAEI
jgi:hypothetical protein